MSISLLSLVGFAAWTLVLLAAVIVYRIPQVLLLRKKADAWTRGRAVDQPAFVTRIESAQANCLEMLPIFAAVVLAASVADAEGVTAALAPWFLVARIGQSVVHMISIHHLVIFFLRFPLFLVQILILAYWIILLV